MLVALLCLYPAQGVLTLTSAQPNALPASPVVILSSSFAIPLVLLLILAAVGTWLGPGPGLVLGLVAGVMRAWFHPMVLNDIFALAAWGLTAGYLLRQPYHGRLFSLLRQPVVGLLTAALVPVLLLALNRLVSISPTSVTSTLLMADYALSLVRSELMLWMLGGLGLGVLFQLLFLKPSWRPAHSAEVIPAYNRSLRARFVFVLMPLLVLTIIISVLAVMSRAVTLARTQSLEEMQRSAINAGDGIANFYYTGPNLLATFATDPNLLDPELRTAVLETNRQVVPFFQEFLVTDLEGTVLSYVPADLRDLQLTRQELQFVQEAADFGISQVTYFTLLPSGEYRLTFVTPILDAELLEPQAVLLGRVQLDINPNMRRAFEALQLTRGGSGFIVDNRGMIVLHYDPSVVLRPWLPNLEATFYDLDDPVGSAYEDVAQEGYRVLTYNRQVVGTPFTVVLQLPFSAVLQSAATISSPLLVTQLLSGLVLLLVVPLLAERVTRPLHTLANAAYQIAQGNLGMPVRISGEDEVAQLGGAFEQMRVRLQDRLNDLSLLLRVSERVSATLNLEEGVPHILEGALEETGAAVARFVLLGSSERSQRVFSVGMTDAAFPALDRAFAAALARRDEPLINQDLWQARGGAPQAGPLRSVAAFPVRMQNRTVASLWVGAREAEAFDEARVNFLITLTTQAAVLVENSRLFEAAEGGRQRLAAILASTADAILVTDQEERLLLINPAAQEVLGLDALAYGRALVELGLPEALSDAWRRPVEDSHTPASVEIPLADGRTFYASLAPIKIGAGQMIGRVAVMRDITHFKELDEMKSDFVATVSHDLRAPLTFIRGYATMLMMVGELNEKQHDYLERILEGIEQMSALISDLLNLRRIEAGVGIRQELCPLGLILVEAVDTMRARATSKGISLRLDPTEGAPEVTGDRTLLRQALGNLVDNAIKYTSVGGEVRVGLQLSNSDQEVVVYIADDGVGIAPEDQPRLFEKFYRVKRRETGQVSGTGLGLALVKSIVERHGGRVWVESQLDTGSTFFVALPLSTEEAPLDS